MKIGILGGTFNPIHNGHLQIGLAAKKEFYLDKILVMPAGNPYFKHDVLAYHYREDMIKLAIQDYEDFEFSSLENSKEQTYTYETLNRLHLQYPDTELYFIVGADSIFHMEQWRNPDKIFQNCTILTAGRPSENDAELNSKINDLISHYSADIRMISVEPVEISSTVIRSRIQNHESINGLVPSSVEEYILKHHLY